MKELIFKVAKIAFEKGTPDKNASVAYSTDLSGDDD